MFPTKGPPERKRDSYVLGKENRISANSGFQDTPGLHLASQRQQMIESHQSLVLMAIRIEAGNRLYDAEEDFPASPAVLADLKVAREPLQRFANVARVCALRFPRLNPLQQVVKLGKALAAIGKLTSVFRIGANAVCHLARKQAVYFGP